MKQNGRFYSQEFLFGALLSLATFIHFCVRPPLPPLPLLGCRRTGRRREGETRQDRAFSLEIITFTLLMYGQTTKDIHRQPGRERLLLCSLE